MQQIALIGNPNTGKTTIFNQLTNSDEHVGNWHGVTVDAIFKSCNIFDKSFQIIDLPGLYSLVPFSLEEKVSSDFIIHNDCYYANICDFENLRRNLFLTLQLIERKKKVAIIINFFKDYNHEFNLYDWQLMSDTLGVPIVLIDGKKKKDIKLKLKSFLNQSSKADEKNKESIYIPEKMGVTLKYFSDYGQVDYEKIQKIENNKMEQLCTLRYEFIDSLLKKIIKNDMPDCANVSMHKSTNVQRLLDKLFLNKFLAFPLFLCIMLLIFYITFGSIGDYLKGLVEILIYDKFVPFLTNILSSFNVAWVEDLAINGIVAGIGIILSFLPQVLLLFLFLNILEESGYLSRLAFIMEDLFSHFGISGKSIFTYLLGFGCSATAILCANNLENKTAKIKTVLTTPFMACSAKLPVLMTITASFFYEKNVLVIFLFYILSATLGFLLAWLFNKTILASETPFSLEFPSYKFPNFFSVCKSVWTNFKLFITRVGGYLLFFSILIWILNSFDSSFNYLSDANNGKSIMQIIAEFLAPVFAPLGFGTWGAVSALLAGLVAKELIISTISILNGFDASFMLYNSVGAENLINFNLCSVLSFLTFIMLYIPCIASISAMRSVIGVKWTIFSVFMQTTIAYLFAYLVYLIAKVVLLKGVVTSLIIMFFIAIISCAIIKIIQMIVFKKCNNCTQCKFYNKYKQ